MHVLQKLRSTKQSMWRNKEIPREVAMILGLGNKVCILLKGRRQLFGCNWFIEEHRILSEDRESRFTRAMNGTTKGKFMKIVICMCNSET